MRNKLGLILLTAYIYVVTIETNVNADGPDLYSSADNILRLKSETFKPTVFQAYNNITHVVQFYNTFCGHCQMFAPVYKELATRVKNWTSVVRIAGIDCSKDENLDVCSNIEGYPTIFIYPPNAHFQDPNDAPLNLRSLNIQWTVDDIEETIVDYIANLTTSRRQFPYAVTALQPITSADLGDVTRVYPLNTQHDIVNDHNSLQDLMFVVESEKSYLGRKLIIEYYRIHSKLELRRILLTNKILLRKILTNEEYLKLDNSQPLLLRINNLNSNSKAQILVRGEANHILPTLEESERQDFVYNRFRSFFEHYYSVELKELDGHTTEHRIEARTKKPSSTNEADLRKQDSELEIHYLVHNDPVGSKRIFSMDLLKGISYMVTHEIRVKGDLNPNEFNTVRNLLTILKKFLPLDRWDATLGDFIDDLRLRLDRNRATYEKDGITGQEMKDLLDFSGADAIRLRYNRESWISCYESDRQHKGYTCSLWLMFHSLTAGEYTKAAPVRSRPTLVLTTMRDYITRFLGCTVCSSNFAKETENLENNLTSRNSSVLWLWNTHNRVNQRLNNEKQANKRPLSDVIYPSQKRCPDCFKSNPDKIGVDGMTLEDIEWSLTNVLDHLLDVYQPNKVVSPTEMAALLLSIKSKVNYDLVDSDLKHAGTRKLAKSGADMNRSVEEWNIQSIFSASDMSICLFLYLSSIVIVAIVCLFLNPKWKRFKTK